MIEGSIWFWVLVTVISIVLFVWLIFSIYRGIRHEILQVIGFGFVLLALSLPETIGAYEELPYYLMTTVSLVIIGTFSILLGILSSSRRWVKKRGTTNLNSLRNLAIFAIFRHPITFGLILLTFSILFLVNSIFSNVLAVLAAIIFILSSYERDSFLQKIYGYPYKNYMKKVPRFNFIIGILRSILSREKDEKTA